jgi:hypothetical protein
MQYHWQTALLLACCSLLAVTSTAFGQSPMRWLAHDMQRPRPPVVTPGKLSLPAAPPSDAVIVFDGSDLSKWRDAEGGEAKWRVRDGYMESVPNSGYVFTADKFGDVQLHVEWATPVPANGRGQARGNSGVFLMGLYEVQVLDSYENDTYPDGQAAAIYGQHPPLVNACLPPGEWQCFDIVFRRPRFRDDGSVAVPGRITVLHNGVLVQDDVQLWGPTAWLQHHPYTRHDDKRPISLQDHGNPVRYRNIWLRELPEPQEPSSLAEQPPATDNLSPDELQKFTGAYGSILGKLGTIELDDKVLRVHMDTGQVIELVPRSASEFDMRYTAGKLVFNLNDEGQVAGFTMHLGGEKYPIRRMPQPQ